MIFIHLKHSFICIFVLNVKFKDYIEIFGVECPFSIFSNILNLQKVALEKVILYSYFSSVFELLPRDKIIDRPLVAIKYTCDMLQPFTSYGKEKAISIGSTAL